MTQPLLQVETLEAGYSEPVVGPVSFSLAPGEVVGLGGTNGAGKSTLLRAITRNARIFGGRVERRPGLRVRHHRQRPEQTPELPLTGRELLDLLGVQAHRLPQALDPILNEPIARRSGGQYQLLQACACLCGDAELVLLDEPTNNLDGNAQQVLGSLLQPEPERAILIVSHERPFLEAHCTRILELEGGRLH
ncbi:MAG: ATP-binding cassette domain-containing protein [Pseudomonadota bacterium]